MQGAGQLRGTPSLCLGDREIDMFRIVIEFESNEGTLVLQNRSLEPAAVSVPPPPTAVWENVLLTSPIRSLRFISFDSVNKRT